MEKKEKKLYVPENIPQSRASDYFDGFGSKELAITGCSFLVAAVLAVLLYMKTEQILFSALIGIGIVGLTIFIVRRDKYDESMIDLCRLALKHKKAQKQYEYEYYNIYKNEE